MNERADPILSLRGMSRSFGAVHALADVDLDLHEGHVHALVGENGAGKSTLVRMLAGLLTPDAGKMTFCGQAYSPRGRKDAEQAGIRIVTQELNLIPTLSVAENLCLTDLPHRLGVIRRESLRERARRLMEQVGLSDLHPDAPVSSLTIGTQQLVEVAAGLSRDCRVFILDEPTASLTGRETDLLFKQIQRLKLQRVAILYISHRMEEIRRIAEKVTVLRDGRWISTDRVDAVTTDEIIRRMVGRTVSGDTLARHGPAGPVVLRVENLTAGDKVRDVSFQARRGEILGFAGLMGSGRTETMRAVFGADPIRSGRVFLRGEDAPVTIASPRDATREGMALLTEDRKGQGLLPGMSVRANITLPAMPAVSALGIIRTRREETESTTLCRRLGIRCRSAEQSVGTLSGGNQQKVVIAKWLFKDSDILIFDEPTRGIDVGAKFEIYRTLAELADQGKAVIIVSSDLKELMRVCDRIAVMSEGKLVEWVERDEFSEDRINAAAFSEYVRPSGRGEEGPWA